LLQKTSNDSLPSYIPRSFLFCPRHRTRARLSISSTVVRPKSFVSTGLLSADCRIRGRIANSVGSRSYIQVASCGKFGNDVISSPRDLSKTMRLLARPPTPPRPSRRSRAGAQRLNGVDYIRYTKNRQNAARFSAVVSAAAIPNIATICRPTGLRPTLIDARSFVRCTSSTAHSIPGTSHASGTDKSRVARLPPAYQTATAALTRLTAVRSGTEGARSVADRQTALRRRCRLGRLGEFDGPHWMATVESEVYGNHGRQRSARMAIATSMVERNSGR
jgi:hypothetical protein